MSIFPYLELLAPAKTAAIGREAILHGADAVYIGGPAFGARDKAGNELRDIAELVSFAHRFRAKIFVTLNTILHDAELEAARQMVWDCYQAGVDALIVQDMGLLELDLPPIDLHASTQCDIRTPEKAKFLAQVGFSQLVLARELAVKEIAAVRKAVPEDTVLEHFIHGALCVAYSGQCNISHAQTGRSANRGDCSQACRLPYTLQDKQGRVVAYQKHLLSVKDNNQSENLRALIAAGVRSFKIEGRYKDAPYVKNITGYYRQLLDEILTEQPDLHPASSGKTQLLFTPNPDKTFHRGATDYFTNGRKVDIGAFDSPSFVGLPLGYVSKIGEDWFEIDTAEPMANGDGLNYTHQRVVRGIRANSAEKVGKFWRVWSNDPLNTLVGLRVGLEINRNSDHAWELLLTRKSSERRIGVSAHLAENPDGISLTLQDEDGYRATAHWVGDKQPAQQPDTAVEQLRQQLDRFGTSEFALHGELTVDWLQPYHIPSSALNKLRRDALTELEAVRAAAYTRVSRKAEVQPPPTYPEANLSFLANVYNTAARDFYAQHGVKLIESAFESHKTKGEVSLMVTRHCIRFSLSLCPKQAKGVQGVQGTVRAEPMTLVSGKDELRLEFDCRACEMHVIGSIRPNILKSPSPSVVPLEFHPNKGGKGKSSKQAES
ncbi:MAG: U32 family peptidase [Gallionella sp.]|nr:U32 family peptidase [Gallionella sp.]MDD4959785.1 U32 family peptidase [Gallionella sp.]